MDLQVNLPLQRRVHRDIFPETGVKWYYYFFNRRKRILTRKIAQRQGNGAADLLIFERHDAVMKTSNGMKWRKEDEQALLGKREGPCCCCCCGPSSKKSFSFSDHGRTDQLEDRNIILNSKLILVSNDYWNKIKPHHRNLQTIGFQNLLELTQDLVVVLKDHEFLSHISMYTFMMGSKKQHNLRKNPWSFNTTARYWVDSSKFRKPIVCRFMP